MKRNLKLGLLFIAISIIIIGILIGFVAALNEQARELGCFDQVQCAEIESQFSISHFAFGAIGFLLALGVYMIFFSPSEEAILKRLEEEKKTRSEDEKFELIMKGLDEFEKKVLTTIKNQEGITQNTLLIKTELSKAKISYVLQDLEKKNLIKRIKKGKTLAIYMA